MGIYASVAGRYKFGGRTPRQQYFFNQQKCRQSHTCINTCTLIAGIVIENGMILITNNNRHFGRIHGLKTGNWKEIF